MRSWISRCRDLSARRAGLALATAASLFLLSQPAAVAHAAWDSYPWVTLAAGYENDRLPDPDLDRFVLPGGSLFGLTPGIRLGGRLGERSRLGLSGQLSYERFRNSDDRSVLGAVATADLRVQLARSWLWRSALAANHYSNSAYETANRIGCGFETGLGFVRRGWSLELIGGVEGRRYGNLVVADDAGVPGIYRDAGLSLGLGGTARAGANAVLSGRLIRQRTEARDPLYDAEFWLAQGSVRTGIALGAVLTLSALGQQRSYSSRPASGDRDSYWQVGAGVDRGLTAALDIMVRYAFARFSDPLGAGGDLHRVTVAAAWGLGRSSRVGSAPDLRLPGGPPASPLREHDVRRFRCHAPAALEVSLVGDFNGWDPTANPLRPDRDGWWQAEVRLAAGSHQYAYVVDGKMVAPADAETTVDDGLGGQNGLIWVEPPGP